jgi:hypothetical protein
MSNNAKSTPISTALTCIGAFIIVVAVGIGSVISLAEFAMEYGPISACCVLAFVGALFIVLPGIYESFTTKPEKKEKKND